VFYSARAWAKKKSWAEKANKSILSSLYKDALPCPSQAFIETKFLVLDCEMTGLNPDKDSILSIGWLEVSKARIIYSDTAVGKSASIHGLHDNKVAGAGTIAKALSSLALQARGKVLVFHHASLDLAFLQKAAIESLGCPFYLAYVDTMEIEKHRLQLQNKTAPLQLASCRARYNLPPAYEHNALSDAQATAELFIAQCAYKAPKEDLKLSDLHLRCA